MVDRASAPLPVITICLIYLLGEKQRVEKAAVKLRQCFHGHVNSVHIVHRRRLAFVSTTCHCLLPNVAIAV